MTAYAATTSACLEHVDLDDLESISLLYRTEDRFSVETDDWTVRPIQHVSGTIEGKFRDDSGDPRRVPMGAVSLARIDLWDDHDRPVNITEVLDAHSQEWYEDAPVIAQQDLDLLDAILIVDRLELEPWARGQGFGLHAAACVIRTWGQHALVVLTAFALGSDDPEGDASHKLSRYWSQLGVRHVARTSPLILIGDATTSPVKDRIMTITAASAER